MIAVSDMEDKEYWISYCETALTLTNSDKLSRWVGFLQGVLVSRNFIRVEEERNFTRTIYKPIYNQLGLDSSTITVE
jgi:hypothetical protein